MDGSNTRTLVTYVTSVGVTMNLHITERKEFTVLPIATMRNAAGCVRGLNVRSDLITV